MAKAAFIKPETEEAILMIYKSLCNGKHPSQKAFIDAVRAEEKVKLVKYPGDSWCLKQFAEWNKIFYPDNKKAPPLPEDLPWHLGTTNQYPVRFEVIPLLICFQSWSVPWDNSIHNLITVRDAKWISRLYDIVPISDEKTGRCPLLEAAQAYSVRESLLEKAGMIEYFDTTEYDRMIYWKEWDKFFSKSLSWIAQSGIVEKIAEKRGTVSNGDNR